MTLERTPSQTVGPYFAIGMTWADGPFVVPDGTAGSFWIRGRLVDGAGDPVSDGLIETWQPDPAGRFFGVAEPADLIPGFRGYGRSKTDPGGRFEILTVKPGRVPGMDGLQAPYLALTVFARGLGKPVLTRIYFADEPEANAEDPILRDLDEPDRSTLIASLADDGYAFDIRLQGARETVFFAI